jgi:hypothetical protein
MHANLKSNHPHKPLVLWIVQMIDQLSILLTHLLQHTKNFLLANGYLDEITTDKFHKAFELLNDCISTLCKFECGTGTIPSCPLLQSDEAKAAKAKLHKASTTSAPSPAPLKPNQIPHISSTNDMHLLTEYNKQYLGYADHDPSIDALGKSFY